MIKLSDWDKLYRHTFDWVLRRLEPDCLKMYKDTEQDWLEALRAFENLQKELFDTYGVKYVSGTKAKRGSIKGIELNADQLFELFHNHLNQYKNLTVRYFIFHWWINLRHYVEGAEPILDCAFELFKDATKEEIKQANKDFAYYEYNHYGKIQKSEHTFNNGRVLEYRGIRFPLDDQWGDAWIKRKDGTITHFDLVWDWWYPIDEFLDLYNI
jgi:hypothetical protein